MRVMPTVVNGTTLLVPGVNPRDFGSIIHLAYDLGTRHWRDAAPIRQLPVSMGDAFLRSTPITAVPGGAVVIGGIKERGLISDIDGGGLHTAYVSAWNRWVDLPSPGQLLDLNRVGHISVWTGHSLVVWGGLRDVGGTNNRADQPAIGGAVYRVSR